VKRTERRNDQATECIRRGPPQPGARSTSRLLYTIPWALSSAAGAQGYLCASRTY